MRVWTAFRPLYFTTEFWLTIAINFVLCVLINLGIDYFFNHDKVAPFPILDLNLVLELSIFHVLVPGLLTLAATSAIRKKIKKGKARAVDPSCYDRYWYQKVFMFSMGEPRWRRRIVLFTLQSIAFPGLIIGLLMTFFCWCAVDFKSLTANNCEVDSLAKRMAITESWKGLSIMWLAAMNWGAAHHAGQPELADVMAGETDLALHSDVKTVDYSSGGV